MLRSCAALSQEADLWGLLYVALASIAGIAAALSGPMHILISTIRTTL
jgi:hypothetical protein